MPATCKRPLWSSLRPSHDAALRPRKLTSEWVIIALFGVGLIGLYRVRDTFKPATYELMAWSIILTMTSEAAFTLYDDAYGPMNLAGHLLKVGAFFLLYRALVEDALRHPLDVIFRDLKAAERRNHALFEEQRFVTEALQRGSMQLPDPPDGVDLAGDYRSSSELALIGGDFYDAFETGDGRIVFALGDVSGKGLDAALLTQTARSTLPAFAAENDRPEDVLAHANDALAPQIGDGRFVTVVFGNLDTRTGRLRLACAGHPPPLVCGPAYCRDLEPDADPPLGLFPGRPFAASEIDLEPGDLVLLHSDGLTDTRRGDEHFGEARVCRTLEGAAAGGPQAVVDALIAEIDRFGSGRVTDDVAVFALKWPGAPSAC